MKFLAIQMGARMHYAVPAILARRNMLAELWTDTHAEDWPARLAARVLPPAMRPKRVRNLMGRQLPPEIPRAAVRSFPARTLWHAFRGTWVDYSISSQLLKRGFGSADGVYSLMFGDAEVIAEARRRGLFVAFEQVLGPDLNPIMAEERNRFPGFEAQESPENDAYYLRAHTRIWREANAILAPSGHVRDGIVALGGPPEKIHLVPYGVDARWFEARPRPEPGRVLFVGSVGLRKGSHYLAEAARMLAARRVPCEIRVVGPVNAAAAASPLFSGPRYVGPVTRAQVLDEFLKADLFVLPTLAEGSATAHIEALACGLPVVTTPNCGTWIHDGVEGFIVPIRDAAALAERIEAIVTDRSLRAEMSFRARELARAEHTWQRYEERLVGALSNLPASRGPAGRVSH
jgi:glycosyltransferase involved in cell wall biosynthesis